MDQSIDSGGHASIVDVIPATLQFVPQVKLPVCNATGMAVWSVETLAFTWQPWVAVAAVNAGGALRNGCIVSRRRAIRLLGNGGGPDERVIAEPLGGFAEHLHAGGDFKRG